MMLHTKYQESMTCGLREEDLFMFSLYKPRCKTCDTWGRPIFGPRGIIWTKLVEVYYMMLDSKYQASIPCGLREEDLSMFQRSR